MKPTEVVVAVITYESATLLPDCLDSIPAAMAGVHSYRVVVADNASPDDSVEVAKTAGARLGVEVLELGANLGYSAGINAIDRYAGPEGALLVINPDIRLSPGAVRLLLKGLDRPGVGIAVPRILAPNGQLDPSLSYEPSIRRALAQAVLGGRLAGRFGLGERDRRPDLYMSESCADWASGAVWLISDRCRAAVETLGRVILFVRRGD